jgi:pimeloyl-ACP methyl ester carboxylesterase
LTEELDSGCFASLEPRRNRLSAGGIEWNYLEWVTGQPQATLLLLHGINSTALSWWRVAPALAERGFRVIAPDMPGHGDTGMMPAGFALSETAKAIGAFGNSFAPGEMLLAGHSWGGANALLIAAEKLLPVSRVALIDPVLRFGNRQSLEPMLRSYTAPIGLPFAESYEKMLVENSSWHRCDCYWRAKSLEKVQREAVQGFFEDNAGMNLLEPLGRIEGPLLLLSGDPKVGGVIGPNLLEAAKNTLKPGQGRVELMSGVGHNLHREAYNEFMSVFLPFLQDKLS